MVRVEDEGAEREEAKWRRGCRAAGEKLREAQFFPPAWKGVAALGWV